MVDVPGQLMQTLMEELLQSVSSQVKVQHDATGLQPAASPSLTVIVCDQSDQYYCPDIISHLFFSFMALNPDYNITFM